MSCIYAGEHRYLAVYENLVAILFRFDFESSSIELINEFTDCQFACVPALGEFIIIARENNYCLYDLQFGNLLSSAVNSATTSPISSIQIHPDGVILATGHEDGRLIIWDIRE